jgi:hypothetical protein
MSPYSWHLSASQQLNKLYHFYEYHDQGLFFINNAHCQGPKTLNVRHLPEQSSHLEGT